MGYLDISTLNMIVKADSTLSMSLMKSTSRMKAEIIEMRKQGMSQMAIANKFGVPRHFVQQYLSKYIPEYSDCRSSIVKDLKEYVQAKDAKTKDKAFSNIDIYLRQTTQDAVAKDKNLDFDDYLQDLRLKFLELINTVHLEDFKLKSFIRKILYNLTNFKYPQKPKNVPIDTFVKEIGHSDAGIDRFEADNLCDFILDSKLLSHYYNLDERRCSILVEYIKEGKTLDEIAKRYNVSKGRAYEIIHMSLERLKNVFNGKLYKNIISGEEKLPKLHKDK